MTVRLNARALRGASLLIAAGLIAAATPASAQVLFDASPTGDLTGSWANTDDSQNFLVKFTLDSAASISEFDIATDPSFAWIGKAVTVRVRADDNGAPTTSDLFQFGSTVTSITGTGMGALVGTSFTPLNLAAGSYWFGVSGSPYELGWSSFSGNNSADVWAMQGGESFMYQPNLGLAFRVIGTAGGAVPEPASWALMIGGFGMVGASMRRRRATVAFG